MSTLTVVPCDTLPLDVLLAELDRREITLWQNANGNLVATPAQAARPYAEALKAHKPALLAAIPFERSGHAKKVRLTLLGETIWLAADNWQFTPDDPKRPHLFEGHVVYRMREMEQLFVFAPALRALAQTKEPVPAAWAESLSLIHAIKRDMGGEFIGAGEGEAE